MGNALVPEFSVSDWRASKHFYCDIIGFTCVYERPEEGFCYLKLGDAELMIDQIGTGRTFDQGHQADHYPFGKGLNVQIRVPSVEPLLRSLAQHQVKIFLPVEDRWYRVGAEESGNRQFVVADPDGYLLRFYQRLGSRPVPGEDVAYDRVGEE
ncbi:VOC family protein [Pseudomonas lijiangensis]|uniref:bleomycin resistance protein n=1 Tax=Pseudomonas lijiangensis TaxID=2995658 RepID=UPI0031BB33E4